MHAKGSGAYGTFTVTNDITKYTPAKVFSEIGKETRVFLRFSTVGGEKGSADNERDPRGFALKFYTEDGNGGSKPKYFPNSFDNIYTDVKYRQPADYLGKNGYADSYDRNAPGENDHYTQPGDLFRLMTPEEQQNTISNIVGAMSGISGEKRGLIINRQLCHFFQADLGLGMGVAQGLGIDVTQYTGAMQLN